jgi:hypothetical protein|eukprot:COSAG06_NODE_212_length_20143_cov_16.516713_8_plen_248_part_00
MLSLSQSVSLIAFDCGMCSYEACVGSMDLVFYSDGWGPTEVLLQSSNDGQAWSDVEHISIALADLTPQTEFDGEVFATPQYVFGATFESRRARFLRLVYIGDIQDPSLADPADPNAPDAYYHSIREIFVTSGCCDATEINSHRHMETNVCDATNLEARTQLVTTTCCPNAKACDANGIPRRRCQFSCALELVPYVTECGGVMTEHVAEYQAANTMCLAAADISHLRSEAVALMDRGCQLPGFILPTP